MAACTYCSAPLPANTNKCRYCGAHNDVDLNGKPDYAIIRYQSDRLCPHCEIPLQTIDLKLDGAFLIERCEHCFGLFFDPGQVETLLESSVPKVFEINRRHLENINADRFRQDKRIKYVKCPVCHVLMNRNAYGYRSGVIIDRCKDHGVWLDSGEITHLLEWKKAGGQLLHEQNAVSKSTAKPAKTRANNAADYVIDSAELDIFNAAATLISRLFDL